MSPKGKSGKGKGAAAASGSSKDKKVDISKRPAKEDLVDKGIIKGDKVAPGIANTANQLEKKQVEDVIRSHIAHRPQKDELLNQNILRADPSNKFAPSGQIQQTQLELKKSQTMDKLNKKLATRTSEDDLLEKNILKAPVTVAPVLVAKQQELQKSKIEDVVSQQAKKHVNQISTGGPPQGLKKRDSQHMEPADVHHKAAAPAPSNKKTKSSHAL